MSFQFDIRVVLKKDFRKRLSAKRKDDVWNQNTTFVLLLKLILVSEQSIFQDPVQFLAEESISWLCMKIMILKVPNTKVENTIAIHYIYACR